MKDHGNVVDSPATELRERCSSQRRTMDFWNLDSRGRRLLSVVEAEGEGDLSCS